MVTLGLLNSTLVNITVGGGKGMKIQEVDFDEVEKALIKDVLEHPERYPDEARLILVIEKWRRQGPSFADEQWYEVVQGDVKEVELESFDEGYPYRRGSRVAIIPLSLATVINLYRYDDTTDPPIKSCTIHIFTRDGWKSVRVY